MQGCRVVGFKQPTAEESAHDFLWRTEQQTPKRGEAVVFNRSHYRDVPIVRVHDLVAKEVWSGRYSQINDFERHLVANGTHILKFFLRFSKEEQGPGIRVPEPSLDIKDIRRKYHGAVGRTMARKREACLPVCLKAG